MVVFTLYASTWKAEGSKTLEFKASLGCVAKFQASQSSVVRPCLRGDTQDCTVAQAFDSSDQD